MKLLKLAVVALLAAAAGLVVMSLGGKAINDALRAVTVDGPGPHPGGPDLGYDDRGSSVKRRGV